MEGWIKLHRKVLDNPIACKDGDHLAVWNYLLLKATHKEYPVMFAGKRITLKPGELITGRKVIAGKFRISESKVQRILSLFENEQQIKQQSCNVSRLISITSWEEYQSYEQEFEQQVNNQRTTSEQPVNTNKNVNNDKNEKNKRSHPAIELPFSSDAFLFAWSEWVTHRNQAKKKLTPKSIEKQFKFLAKKTESEAIAIIEHAIEKGWQGLYDIPVYAKQNIIANQYKKGKFVA
jgi:hypothetical protein